MLDRYSGIQSAYSVPCNNKVEELTNAIEIKVAKDDQFLIAKQSGFITAKRNKNVDVTVVDVLYVPELRDNLNQLNDVVT